MAQFGWSVALESVEADLMDEAMGGMDDFVAALVAGFKSLLFWKE